MSELTRIRQPYGSRWVKLHGEAYRIWLSSTQEPAEVPRFGVASLLVLEDDEDKRMILFCEVWSIAEHYLTPRQLKVLCYRFFFGMTLQEVGKIFEVTQERIKQIEHKAVRRLRLELAKRRDQ